MLPLEAAATLKEFRVNLSIAKASTAAFGRRKQRVTTFVCVECVTTFVCVECASPVA